VRGVHFRINYHLVTEYWPVITQLPGGLSPTKSSPLNPVKASSARTMNVMIFSGIIVRRALAAAILTTAAAAHSQALPTASQALQLSAFGAASGVFTGLYGGHNAGITAGADLSMPSLHGYHPSIEVRGIYPFDKGQVDSQKSVMGGVKVDHRLARSSPYVDFLAGRGEIDYQNGGFTVGLLKYISTSTNVYSLGAGADLDVSHHFALKADYQYQFWKTPVIPAGNIHPSVISLGVVYRFDLNHSYKRTRQ
jgi:hypothetical protein